MSEQFPMFKLGTLIARQISSPIATRIKEYAKNHPVFSQNVCGRLAWYYRYGEIHCRMMALRLAGNSNFASRHQIVVPRVSPAEAHDLGADLLGELIVFMLGATILIFEYNRQANIKAKKTRARKEKWRALKNTLEELKIEAQRQNKQLESAKERLHILRNQNEK
ncbi:putative OPA3-like protein CG13603 [Hyposmocoma kahamanoa]|uniref:putative OPA3-like protein CG13603 n=1 Tax=Hyposmocoma kahamanoa TaxID=1477025 RepID=UPI000E6D951F|nr:putative OPA3-like protein CG13603 [Hyposmocoma kahamanoa]